MEDDDAMPTLKIPRIGKLPKAPPQEQAPSAEATAPLPLPPFLGITMPMPVIPDLPSVPTSTGAAAPATAAQDERPLVDVPWFLRPSSETEATAEIVAIPSPVVQPAAPRWEESEEAPWAPSSWRPTPSPSVAPAPPSAPYVAWAEPDPLPSGWAMPLPAAPTPPAPPAWVQNIPTAPSALAITTEKEEEDLMADTQWEYCRVQLDSGMYSQKQTLGRYPYYVRVTIDYYGGDTPPTENFGEDTDQTDRPNKVWGKVVGLLGLANWEMVNVYLGTAKDLSLVNVMAYFKRPVQAGRGVGDPKIKL